MGFVSLLLHDNYKRNIGLVPNRTCILCLFLFLFLNGNIKEHWQII